MASKFDFSFHFRDENADRSKKSVLKSIFPQKGHRRSQSGCPATDCRSPQHPNFENWILPTDHPHAQTSRPLGELSERALNQGMPNGSPSKQQRADAANGKSLHKKTKSSVSLKSLLNKDKKEPEPKAPRNDHDSKQKKPKKTKSTTSLSGIFKRSQRGKKDTSYDKEDKENAGLTRSSNEMPPPPIPRSRTHSIQSQLSGRYMPPSGRSLEEEMSLYTPRGYSPSSQRNFHDFQRPSLTKRPEPKWRPKSEYGSSSTSSVKDILHSMHKRSPSAGSIKSNSSRTHPLAERPPAEKRKTSSGNRGSRVMAAIAAFSAKDKNFDKPKSVDTKEIESEFERLLVSRTLCSPPHLLLILDFYRTHVTYLTICETG